MPVPSPSCTVGSKQEFREQRVPGLIPNSLFSYDNHCDQNHSCLTANSHFSDFYVGKQSVVWKENHADYRDNILKENTVRCTGWHNVTEIWFYVLNTIMQQMVARSPLAVHHNSLTKF